MNRKNCLYSSPCVPVAQLGAIPTTVLLEKCRGPGRVRQATIGRWLIDVAAHQVRRAASDDARDTLRLTPTEWRILEVLLRRPGQLVGSAQLLTAVWGPGFGQRTNYLRFHMARLRRKLEDNPARPRHLLTEPGMGYRYQP
jgi:two-component system KDP operon response regulator KdpE